MINEKLNKNILDLINENKNDINKLDNKLLKIGKLLWTGNFTTGSITVPDISKYTLIAINVAGVLCLGTQLYGGCSFTRFNTLETTSYGYRYTYDSTNETEIYGIF